MYTTLGLHWRNSREYSLINFWPSILCLPRELPTMEAIVSPTPTDSTPAKSGKTSEKSHPTKAWGAKHQKNHTYKSMRGKTSEKSHQTKTWGAKHKKNHTLQKHEGQNIRKITPYMYKNMRGKMSVQKWEEGANMTKKVSFKKRRDQYQIKKILI